MPPRRRKPTNKLLLTAWLAAPLLCFGVLCWWIIASLYQGIEKQEAVGAGANNTGGANGLVEPNQSIRD